MATKNLKKNARLTLVVDGPKDFIEKVETAIHSILAFRVLDVRSFVSLRIPVQ